MKNKMIQLFASFFKIGAFTFGGGLVMIPLIQKEAVEKRKWVSEDDVLDIVAIAESTPGPIAINAATFIGYKTAGLGGAFAATFGVVLPSFVIISILSVLLSMNIGLLPVKYAFFGIRAGVVALLFRALVAMYKKSPKDIFSYIIMAGAFVTVAVFKINVFITVICCAVFGLIYTLIRERGSKNDIA